MFWFTAKFYGDDAPGVAIRGNLMPESSTTDPREFFVSVPNQLPQGKTRGQMTLETPGSTPISGSVMSPNTPRGPFLFYPNPIGSYYVNYYQDGVAAAVPGLYIPSMQPGTPDQFEPRRSNQLPSQQSHGQITPATGNSPPISGTMGPDPLSPDTLTEFTKDPPNSRVG